MPDTSPASERDFDAILDELRADPKEKRAITLPMRGLTLTIPAPLDWSNDVLKAQASQDAGAIARAMLGDKQYEEYAAKGGTDFQFMKVLNVLMGDVGESEAS